MRSAEERGGCLRIAYADPPYLGMGARLYGEHHPEAAAWDDPETHRELVATLARDYPDGWAMSLSSTTLHTILPMCPPAVRVAAWVKPFASFKPGVNPAYAWEPVIWMGGRSAKERGGRSVSTVRDFVIANIAMKKGLPGAKPAEFCFWLFDLLGLQRGDEFVDLFPGSGAVSAAWERWRAYRATLLLEEAA